MPRRCVDEVHDSRRRLSGTLLTGAALTFAFLVGWVVDDVTTVGSSDVYWPAVFGAGAGVLVAAVAYRVAPTAVGVVGLLTGVITVVVDLVGAVDRNEGDAIAVALFLVGVGWLALTELRWFDQVTVARTLGVTTALIGAQVPVMGGDHSWLGYLLTALVAVLGIAIYLGKVAWPYLAGAVVAVTLVVPEAVSDWTDGSFGAIGAVLVSGMTLLGASFAGYRVPGPGNRLRPSPRRPGQNGRSTGPRTRAPWVEDLRPDEHLLVAHPVSEPGHLRALVVPYPQARGCDATTASRVSALP